MNYQTTLLFSFSFLLFLYYLLKEKFITKVALPPGPKPWPIIGNILQLTENPHRYLGYISESYGPLMTLKLGSFTTIVVSSVDMAKEVFQNHDLSFSSRKIPFAAKALNHHNYSVAWLPVSPKWRNLRKICSVNVFTKKSLDATELLRQQKVKELLDYVRKCCGKCQAVEISGAAFTTLLNLMSNTFFSVDLVSQSSKASQELRDVAFAIMEASGKPNLADFFPFFGYFDLFGVKRNGENCMSKFLSVFDEIIKKKLGDACDECDDVLSTLLKISKESGSEFSQNDIKHLLLDLFVAGTDTTSTTLEWAMSELLRNSEKMATAQDELDKVVGKNELVKECDVEKLPYLQAVVKETLRLHPPAPFMIPRKAENDVQLCGYEIPKGSQLLVNAWAINRDPSAWDNPAMFLPERFLESKIDFRGHQFKLVPFGAGRRICPGLPLADRMLHLMLANLLHSFNWKLGDGMRGEDVDMSEMFGLSLHKAKPLLALPVAK